MKTFIFYSLNIQSKIIGFANNNMNEKKKTFKTWKITKILLLKKKKYIRKYLSDALNNINDFNFVKIGSFSIKLR